MLDQDLKKVNVINPLMTRSDRTSGWPFVGTVGPCNEWQETICTSSGKYFSKASHSGALTDVWPETMAPTLVADDDLDLKRL